MEQYVKNDKVVGFATFGPFREWPAYKYTIEHSVYVHKNYRNKSIGRKLIKEIIKIANEREYSTLIAGIDAAFENLSSLSSLVISAANEPKTNICTFNRGY